MPHLLQSWEQLPTHIRDHRRWCCSETATCEDGDVGEEEDKERVGGCPITTYAISVVIRGQKESNGEHRRSASAGVTWECDGSIHWFDQFIDQV